MAFRGIHDADPSDTFVLVLQDRHRSHLVDTDHTGTCVFDVAVLCKELLGVIPPADAIRGAIISLPWLCYQLSTPSPDADEVTLERSARGFILALIGSFLFANKKGVNVPMCFLPLLRDLTHTATYS